MASPPPNPDTRDLPYGWIQQYNWEYKQWFYINTREVPPRSIWEHPLGPMPQGFAPPLGPPPADRNRSHYGGPPPPPYGGYQSGYTHQPPQGYYNTPPAGYACASGHRGHSQERIVYVEEERERRKKGPGWGTALAAGGAGLIGGALLTEAIENHDEYERQEGFEQGFGDGYADGYDNGFDNGFDTGFY